MAEKTISNEKLFASVFAENIELKAKQQTLTEILVKKGIIDEQELNEKYKEVFKSVGIEGMKKNFGLSSEDAEKKFDQIKKQ